MYVCGSVSEEFFLLGLLVGVVGKREEGRGKRDVVLAELGEQEGGGECYFFFCLVG